MKSFPILVLLVLIVLQIQSQTITGKVTDADSGEPLVFVSIGVMETPIGTITDEKGNFSFEIKEQLIEALVRFSMIGYKAQTFSIAELKDKENAIKLKVEPVQLAAVDINFVKIRKVGETRFSRIFVCGWGGTEFGRGYEIGTKIDLGEELVNLLNLNIRVSKQSFDSSLFRLHIRNVLDSLPNEELLTENIFITISEKSGWVQIDLSTYNLLYKGEIALTLEWIKVFGIYEDRVKGNSSKNGEPYVHFSTKRKRGFTYAKWGVEAEWILNNKENPSIYLNVQE
jgi:hypothetical protein